MAKFQDKHPLGVEGSLFTDHSCIDCGTCYHLAPTLFKEADDRRSAVIKQPLTNDEWVNAKRSILSCPTNSIGLNNPPDQFKKLPTCLPLEISDNIYYLGFTSESSYGASSYLIMRDEGNVLIDSPRFNKALISEINKLGGVKFMFLTHKDDVADHKAFRDYFNCQRIIHIKDLTKNTSLCEQIITGTQSIYLSPEIKLIMTPGHTKGHMCLLYKNKYLFTGDHLFVNEELLYASRSVCWGSWDEQTLSMKKLLHEKFEWVLPGHGGWGNFSVQEVQKQMSHLIEKMEGTA
jgi:glyoxylase-like metal-dependent hydrolase (beta-lactamase superfamily II)/ferredoxin